MLARDGHVTEKQPGGSADFGSSADCVRLDALSPESCNRESGLNTGGNHAGHTQEGSPRRCSETITYFFLMTHNEKGAQQTPKVKEQAVAEVTKAVRDEGGECTLYLAEGSAYDYVSVMTACRRRQPSGSRMSSESRGTVKAKALPGLMVFAQLGPESAGGAPRLRQPLEAAWN